VKAQVAVLRNVAWVAMAGYVEMAVGLLAGVVIARALGPTEYGHYAFGIWLCGAVMMAANNGLPASSIRFIAEARGAGQADLAAALVSRFARIQAASSTLVLAAFAVTMAVQPVADWRHQLPLMLFIALVAIASRASFWMWGAIGRAHELFLPENRSLMVSALVNLVCVLALAWQGAGTVEFFALYAVLGVVSNLLVRLELKRSKVRAVPGPLPGTLQPQVRRHLLLTGLLMLLLVGTNRGVEMSLLKVFSSAEAVGYFAIAGALTKGAVGVLAGGMVGVLLPAMSRRFGQSGQGSLVGILSESARLYWWVGLFIAGLGWTVSEGLVHLLYGSRYDGAIRVLTWNLVIAGLLVINGAASAVLTASDRQIDRVGIVVAVLVVNLVAGFVFIPRFGLDGAIASLAITHLFDTAMCWFYASRRVPVRLPVRSMAVQGLVAVLAAGLGWVATAGVPGPLAFLVGALVFVVSYLTLCVVLKTMRASDFDVAAHVVGRLGRKGADLSARIGRMRRWGMPE
jgi:O-antigen/teichoic acid export membrane protein